MSPFRKYILALFLFSTSLTFSQTYNDDAAIWFNLYLQKKVNKKLDIHLNQQDRFTNNITEFNLAYADMGITYHFNKAVKVLCDYVLIERRRLDGSYSTRHQGYIALMLKKEWRRLAIVYRNMLQIQTQDIYVSDDGRVPVYYERNKLTIRYDLNKRYTVYVAQELFLPFYQVKRQGLDRSRSFAGIFYSLSKRNTLELYYMFQTQLNAFNRINRSFVYGIGFAHQF